MSELMIDLETAGSSYNAAILSLGAVAFDEGVQDSVESIKSVSSRMFYTVIDLDTQNRDRFAIDPSTFYWWMKQSQRAREAIIPPEERVQRVSIRGALYAFASWCKQNNTGKAYSYGATFDHVILQHAYNVLGQRNPIHYRNQLCMRTIVTEAAIACPQLEGLTDHNALDDCIRQTIWLQQCIYKIRSGGEVR